MPVETIVAPQTQTLLSTFDVVYPDKFKQKMARYKGQGWEHLFMMKTMGFSLPAANRTYSWYEDDHIIDYISTKTDEAATGAGNAMTITLSTDDVTADGEFFVRTRDHLLFEGSSGDVVGIIRSIDVTTPSAPIITVYPAISTQEIPALTAGDPIMVLGNTMSEGSEQPDGRISRVTEYSNKLAIIGDTKVATGSSLNDKTWFEIAKSPTTHRLPNGETWGYYRKSIEDLDHQMYTWLSGLLLFGVQVSNTSAVDPVTSKILTGTQGLFPYAYQEGTTYGYVPGTLNIYDFDSWDLTLEQEYSYGNEVMLYFATELDHEVENLLKEANQYTGAEFMRQGAQRLADQYFFAAGDMREKIAMAIGFNYVVKADRTFHLKRMRTLSNPQTFGLSGYTKTKLGIILPMGTEKDPKTGQDLPTMGYRYSKLGGYNREYEIWVDGAAGGQQYVQYTGKSDNIYHYVRSEIGGQFIAGNRFIVINPS
jgi:hypothetical protein